MKTPKLSLLSSESDPPNYTLGKLRYTIVVHGTLNPKPYTLNPKLGNSNFDVLSGSPGPPRTSPAPFLRWYHCHPKWEL